MALYYLSAVIDILRMSVLHPDWATLLLKHVEAENGIQVKDEHQLCLISDENVPCKWFNCFWVMQCQSWNIEALSVNFLFFIFLFWSNLTFTQNCVYTDALMEVIKKVTKDPAIPANLLTSIRAVTNLFKNPCYYNWLYKNCSEVGIPSLLLFTKFDYM